MAIPNTSATGGYLPQAATPNQLEDDALADFLQSWVAGITGIAGQYVRPRWQPEPPNIPGEGIDWVAFGITQTEPDAYGADVHYSDGEGRDQFRRHETLTLLASFYGPNAGRKCGVLRDGMQIAQNREPLMMQGMGVVGVGVIRTVPEQIKEKWVYRVDMEFSIKRQIVRDYAVLNLLAAPTDINNENYHELTT